MNPPSGVIASVMQVIGMPPGDERDALFADLLVTIGTRWRVELTGDDYGPNSEYWTFGDSGCILLWANQILLTAFLFPRGDDEEGVDFRRIVTRVLIRTIGGGPAPAAFGTGLPGVRPSAPSTGRPFQLACTPCTWPHPPQATDRRGALGPVDRREVNPSRTTASGGRLA